ncbi:hypothetical protein K0B03_00485 [Patescibacteria group bacterium]|nr:hypothetical protein [Patescibacteria group bacterium]
MLVQNRKPRKKRGAKNFQYLGFATCGICGYAITAERHIKKSGLKFVYYYCNHKSKTVARTENCFFAGRSFNRTSKKPLSKSFFA